MKMVTSSGFYSDVFPKSGEKVDFFVQTCYNERTCQRITGKGFLDVYKRQAVHGVHRRMQHSGVLVHGKAIAEVADAAGVHKGCLLYTSRCV